MANAEKIHFLELLQLEHLAKLNTQIGHALRQYHEGLQAISLGEHALYLATLQAGSEETISNLNREIDLQRQKQAKYLQGMKKIVFDASNTLKQTHGRIIEELQRKDEGE